MNRKTHYSRGGVAMPGSAQVYHTGTWRTSRPIHQHGLAPCRHGCPAGEDPQGYIAAVSEGRIREAWEMLVMANPLPAVTGRVCPHPCESVCNRASYDEPLAIHQVERFLGDAALREGWDYPVAPPTGNGPRIAVVGAGPAGLSCAWQLLRLGRHVTLFEAEPEAGGTCAAAIPPYRLPRRVIAEETRSLLALPGLEFRPCQRLGRDFSLDELREEFPIVFLGVGAQRPRAWSVNGVVPAHLHTGLDLLKEWLSIGRIPVPHSAAVIGGGNTAVDIARVLKRAGVAEVNLITHDSPPGASADAMPALAREVERAEEEGVDLWTHRGVTRMILHGERAAGIELVHMKKLADAQGKLHRVPFEGTEEVLHVDMVVPATGEDVDPQGLQVLLQGAPFIPADALGATAEAGVYTGGDSTERGGTVAAAIGAGRVAAVAMARLLEERPPEQEIVAEPVAIELLNLAYFEPAAREVAPVLATGERHGEAEVDQGLDAGQVAREAARCFSCGNCLACDNCFTLCPDAAVLKTREATSDGSNYVFDYDYCKGCGLCATECPTGFIQMHPEP